jgi:hypothetical protein
VTAVAEAPARRQLTPEEIAEDAETERVWKQQFLALDYIRSMNSDRAHRLLMDAESNMLLNPWVALMAIAPDELVLFLNKQCPGWDEKPFVVDRLEVCEGMPGDVPHKYFAANSH